MEKIRLAINGFGRIGRAAFKLALENPDIEVVAINDLANPVVLTHLLKYDTAYGTYPRDLGVRMDGKMISLHDNENDSEFFKQEGSENYLVVDTSQSIRMFSERDPKDLPWKELKVDVVLECTGIFVKDDASRAHIDAGAKKVVVSAPTKGGQAKTFLIGGNHDELGDEELISNASCTTNCTSPVVSAIHSAFGVKKAMLTTVHAVTAGQNVVDGPPNPRKPDMRRARASAWNIVPTTTGAAKATTKVIPDLENMFDGIAIRVPVITGSLSDITMVLDKKVTVKEVNDALIAASKKKFYDGVLKASYEPIVSSDIIGSTFSAIADLSMTKVVDGDLVKVLAWYDNEWGYSNRLVEMAVLAGKQSNK
jgi:glyceraldehyde 3-phosphate dehydrogenase